jgi:hypothetical protein
LREKSREKISKKGLERASLRKAGEDILPAEGRGEEGILVKERIWKCSLLKKG